VRRGDPNAYAALVRRHAPAAVRTATFLGAGADAEDVVQEAFVKAYRALDRYREGAAFRPWLLRIVANETRNLHRSAGRRTAREARAWQQVAPLLAGPHPSSASSTGPDLPLDALVSTERRTELVAALGRLPAPYREVVTCRYLLELDEDETAAVLGRPRGTVKSRLHRALRALAADLRDRDREEVTRDG
jgi:RNA polymerase sigma-70 factor (ECF subfamily)